MFKFKIHWNNFNKKIYKKYEGLKVHYPYQKAPLNDKEDPLDLRCGSKRPKWWKADPLPSATDHFESSKTPIFRDPSPGEGLKKEPDLVFGGRRREELAAD